MTGVSEFGVSGEGESAMGWLKTWWTKWFPELDRCEVCGRRDIARAVDGLPVHIPSGYGTPSAWMHMEHVVERALRPLLMDEAGEK